jgi:hypothetical protein
MYLAHRNGFKKEGYPELDQKLVISQTNVSKFFLEEFGKTISLISSEYNLEKKYGI